jgi:ABC-2 type transport system permease protein
VRALSIAWKDLRQTYRGRAFLVLIFAGPLLLAFLLGMAFGSGDNFSIAAVKTVVVNQDRGAATNIPGSADLPAAGAVLVATLTRPELAELLDVSEMDDVEAAKASVDDGGADVAVIIPSGLSAALASGGMGQASTSSLEPGSSPGSQSALQVEIYRDPALTVGPSIVAAVVESVVRSLNGTSSAAAASVQLGLSSGITDGATLARLATDTAQAFTSDARSGAPIALEGRAPVLESVDEQKQPNVASQVLVGMMLFFMLFGASIPARGILDEHLQGTLPRLFTTPTPRSVILVGKYIGVFLVVLIQVTVLVLAGWLLFGADWGGPGPLIVLIVVSALVAASLGLVTVSFAKTANQAGAVSSAIFVFLALISGNFTGGVDVSGAYAIVRRVSPLGWLMEAWGNVLFGDSWRGIGLQVLVVLGFALAFFGIATFFFRRRYA